MCKHKLDCFQVTFSFCPLEHSKFISEVSWGEFLMTYILWKRLLPVFKVTWQYCATSVRLKNINSATMRESSLKNKQEDWNTDENAAPKGMTEPPWFLVWGRCVLGVQQGGKSRTWGCVALPCVTQKKKKKNREESPQSHRFIPPELQHLPHSWWCLFPHQSNSIPSDLYSGITILFCTPVSHFQVFLPSFERLPFCHSLLAPFLVVYQLCSLPLLVLHPRHFPSFSFKEKDIMAALRAVLLLQLLSGWGIWNRSLEPSWRPWLTAGREL